MRVLYDVSDVRSVSVLIGRFPAENTAQATVAAYASLGGVEIWTADRCILTPTQARAMGRALLAASEEVERMRVHEADGTGPAVVRRSAP